MPSLSRLRRFDPRSSSHEWHLEGGWFEESWVIRLRAREPFLDRPVSIREPREFRAVPAPTEHRTFPTRSSMRSRRECLPTVKCSPSNATSGSPALGLITPIRQILRDLSDPLG